MTHFRKQKLLVFMHKHQEVFGSYPYHKNSPKGPKWLKIAQNYLRITLNPKYYKVKIGRKCRSDPIRAKKAQNDPKEGKIKERIGKTSCLSICNMHIPLINICGHGCLGKKKQSQKTDWKKPNKATQNLAAGFFFGFY